MTTQWKPDGTICQACWGSGCRYCDARKATPAEPTGAQADDIADAIADLGLGDQLSQAEAIAARKVIYDCIEFLHRDLEAARGEIEKKRDAIVEHCVTGLELHVEIASLRAQLEAAKGERDEWKKNCSLLTHQLITCGVAASHPDATLSGRAKDYGGPWNSKQAEEVRTLRADRDSLRAQLASAAAELGNIAHAKRFDRAVFWSDTEFADWAQSRCHAALSSDAAANKEREP